SVGVDLQAAEHRNVDMAAADQGERHCAVEGRRPRKRADRSAARIGQQGMRHALLRNRPSADQTVLRLEEYVEFRRHIVCDQSRNADAEIDQVSRTKLERDAPCYDGLGVHGFTSWVHLLAMR